MTCVDQLGRYAFSMFTTGLFKLVVFISALFLTTAANAETVLIFKVGDDILEMLAEDVAMAAPAMDQYSRQAIQIRLVPAKAKLVFEFTGRHQGEQVQIIVCNTVLAEPRIMEPISGSEMQIAGSFTAKEAAQIARQLKSPSCGPVS